MAETKEVRQSATLIQKIQSLKNSPDTFEEVKSELEKKYEQLCKKLHGLTLIPKEGRSIFGYGSLFDKFSLYIDSRNKPGSPTLRLPGNIELKFKNSNNALTLDYREKGSNDVNSEQIFLQGNDIAYCKILENGVDASVFKIQNGSWQENKQNGTNSISSHTLNDIIEKLVGWVEGMNLFEKEIDTICLRNDDEVRNNFGPQTNQLYELTTRIHDAMYQTSFAGLGEKPHENILRKKKHGEEKNIILTVDNKYISVDGNENETLQSGIDGSFRYFCGSFDDGRSQKITLHANGNIDFILLDAKGESKNVTYTYEHNGADRQNENYEIYWNLLNFLTTKRQECIYEFQKALDHRDEDKEGGETKVQDLKDELLK